MPNPRRLLVALVCLGTLSALPSPAPAKTDESLLQRLFRLLRPAAKYEGRLSDVLAKATQRSGVADTLPRVLFVDRRSGTVLEWVRGRGSVEPVVCPDGRTVVLRRGSNLERAQVGIDSGKVRLPDAGTPVAGAVARQLFACTQVVGAPPGTWEIWIETAAGELRTVKMGTAAASPAEVPQPFRADPQGDVGPALRKLQGVRADGLCAQVRDARLVVETSGTTDVKSLSLPMPVTGDPAWLGDSDWIVVTGLLD